MKIDLVKLVQKVRLHVPVRSPSMENYDLSRVKRFMRWTWLRLSMNRFLARNAEEAATGLTSPRQGLAAMLDDHDGADVTFTVGNRMFRANRHVLAAGSPVFEAELFGPMKETSTRHVKMTTWSPPSSRRSSTSRPPARCPTTSTASRRCSTCWWRRTGTGCTA
jgi:hypothetical protein